MEDNSSIEPQAAGSTVDTASDAVKMIQSAMDGNIEPQVQAKEEEVKVEPSSEEKVQEERFAAKFAALSRKEKAMRQREAQLQQQSQQLEERLKALEAQQAEMQTFRSLPDRLKKEPFTVLQEQGLTYEQLAEMVLNDGKPTPDMLLSEYEKKFTAKMQELEQKLAEKEAKEQEARYEAAIEQFQGQLIEFVEQSPDYELIRANEASDLVFQVIEEHHNETGEILSNKEACDAVESYLLDEAKKLVDREKVKKLLQPQTPNKPAAPTGKSSPTLSNAAAAQAPKSAAKILSNEESKIEAAKLIRWDD